MRTLKLRRFLDARPLPGFVFDLQSPWLLATNPQFRDLIGYSTAELLRMRMDDLRPEEDVPLMLNTLHNGVHEAVIRWRYRTKDGLLVWVRLKFRNMRYIAPGRRVQHVRFCVITDAATRDTGLRPEFRGIDVSSLGDKLRRLIRSAPAAVHHAAICLSATLRRRSSCAVSVHREG